LTNGCAAFALLKMGFCLPEGLAGAGEGLNAALKPLDLPPVWHMGECLDNARASAFFRTIAAAAGEPLTRLPLAFSSPEWSNEKGIGAALGFRLLGLNSYHCITPPVAGSDKVSRFFYEGTQELVGAVMVVDPDPVKLAARIVADFDCRRSELGWQKPAPPLTTRLMQIHNQQKHEHAHAHGHHHTHEGEEHHE
jgi:carbon-monoxide dehydrogenase catalytic subunit